MSKSLAPGFLIALPSLRDPNFRRTVVLLLRQNEEGAIGVVVNQPCPLRLGDLCRDHDIVYAGAADKRIRSGGPCNPEQGLVLYGAEHADPDGEAVVEGLHVSASRTTLARLCALERGRFHCFAGYAGWGPGQLERELGEDTWLVARADASIVLETDPREIWTTVLRGMGIDPATLVSGGNAEA
jgi:putative transcriptional regulator